MASDPGKTGGETEQQRFERILSREAFRGLKAVLDKVSPGPEGLWAGVRAANSYEELLAKLGYKVTLTRQIHVQDSYSRLGQPGGIRSVLPYYDVSTQSSFPTLVNSDATVTNTPKGAAFFNELLAELKRQLKG